MKLKINIEYDQLLQLIHQLPEEEIEKLVITLQSEITSKKASQSIKDLLLQAPTWSDSDFNSFKQARDLINKSRIT